jgi:hypothetical protein
MSDLSVVWIWVAVALAPSAAMAASDPAELQHKADWYAFESRQYGAAGKPVTNAIAKRYARLSGSYGARASAARTER